MLGSPWARSMCPRPQSWRGGKRDRPGVSVNEVQPCLVEGWRSPRSGGLEVFRDRSSFYATCLRVRAEKTIDSRDCDAVHVKRLEIPVHKDER